MQYKEAEIVLKVICAYEEIERSTLVYNVLALLDVEFDQKSQLCREIAKY